MALLIILTKKMFWQDSGTAAKLFKSNSRFELLRLIKSLENYKPDFDFPGSEVFSRIRKVQG